MATSIGAPDDNIEATEEVSTREVFVGVEADGDAAGTLPNVDTKTLIRVIRKTPNIDKLLILSADANPLFLCTL